MCAKIPIYKLLVLFIIGVFFVRGLLSGGAFVL